MLSQHQLYELPALGRAEGHKHAISAREGSADVAECCTESL